MVAALALVLAGCAAMPPRAAGEPPRPCDAICRMLRFFDLDSPSPIVTAAAAPLPLTPVAAPPGRHPERRPPVVHASLGHTEGPTLRPSEEAVPVPAETVSGSAAERPAAVAAAMPAPPPQEVGLRRTLAGSPPIAPPWFEPWPAR